MVFYLYFNSNTLAVWNIFLTACLQWPIEIYKILPNGTKLNIEKHTQMPSVWSLTVFTAHQSSNNLIIIGSFAAVFYFFINDYVETVICFLYQIRILVLM